MKSHQRHVLGLLWVNGQGLVGIYLQHCCVNWALLPGTQKLAGGAGTEVVGGGVSVHSRCCSAMQGVAGRWARRGCGVPGVDLNILVGAWGRMMLQLYSCSCRAVAKEHGLHGLHGV